MLSLFDSRARISAPKAEVLCDGRSLMTLAWSQADGEIECNRSTRDVRRLEAYIFDDQGRYIKHITAYVKVSGVAIVHIGIMQSAREAHADF
jgi:hypothetical protein